MAMAEIGLFTAVSEATATAVGTGILLGGFATGVFGMAVGWARPLLDARVLAFSHIGGVVGAGLAIVDLVLRYGD